MSSCIYHGFRVIQGTQPLKQGKWLKGHFWRAPTSGPVVAQRATIYPFDTGSKTLQKIFLVVTSHTCRTPHLPRVLFSPLPFGHLDFRPSLMVWPGQTCQNMARHLNALGQKGRFIYNSLKMRARGLKIFDSRKNGL